MPSSRRIDACGMFHHVMNRGLSQRTVFETRRDVRFFLSLLAREVRAGNLRMLAYAILTTHFHLLAQSPRGELSAVMRRVESRYVRYFNRTRDRRGPLFERRFLSKPIGSHSHRLTVLRYIDQNAPEARLVAHASRYPYCSAYHYARARRPKWLDCSYVDGLLGNPPACQRQARYQQFLGKPLLDAEVELIEQRWASAASGATDELDSLIEMAPRHVRDWMARRARLADGTRPGLPYVSAARVLAVVKRHAEGRELVCSATGSRRSDAWPVLCTGLLRDLAGLTYSQIATRTERSVSAAKDRYGRHVRLIDADERYGELCGVLAAECLQTPGP